MIGGSSCRRHPGLDICIEAAGFLDCAAAAEHDFGGLGGKLAAGLGRTGLNDDRPALDRPRNVQRPAHRQMFALVVKHMHFLRIEEDAACLVPPPCVVCPAIP
jgi:hypothetical protein